jgi:DNA-binding NarL/FixJ family response regulator
LAEGRTEREAAGRLGIVTRTIKFHSANLRRKTGACNTMMALRVILLGRPAIL